jgi:hypothetical protein
MRNHLCIGKWNATKHVTFKLNFQTKPTRGGALAPRQKNPARVLGIKPNDVFRIQFNGFVEQYDFQAHQMRESV